MNRPILPRLLSAIIIAAVSLTCCASQPPNRAAKVQDIESSDLDSFGPASPQQVFNVHGLTFERLKGRYVGDPTTLVMSSTSGSHKTFDLILPADTLRNNPWILLGPVTLRHVRISYHLFDTVLMPADDFAAIP